MRKLKKLLLFIFITSSFLPMASTIYGNTDAEWAVLLSEKLNELKMFDYSELVLEQEMAKKPVDIDLLKIQMGMTKFASNKQDEANKIISSIEPSSAHYPDSRRALGLEAAKKQKYDIASTALEEYFKVYLAKPPTTELGKKEFLEAVNYLIHSYKQMGKVAEAEKVVKYPDCFDKDQGADKSPLGDRDTLIKQLQIKMDTVEEMIDKKKDGWKPIVTDSLKIVENIQWGGQDNLTALSYIEMARGLYFLGRLDDALKELQDRGNEELIFAFDEAYKEQQSAFMAPSVYRFYWLGRIYNEKGKLATTDKEKIEFYSEGAKNFFRIVTKFEKFPRWDDALGGFLTSKDELEKLGKKIEIPAGMKDKFVKKKGGASLLDKKEGDQYFSDGKFDNAITSYTKAFLADRRSSEADVILARLAFSYLKSNQILEAMVIAMYLGDYYRKAENTPLLMAQVGEALWSAGQSKRDPKNKDKNDAQADVLFDDAIIVYNSYLKNFAADQYAGDISYRIAKFKLKNAEDLAVEANKLPQGNEKAKKAADAREAYKNTAPYFQNILDNFAHTKWGIISAYMLPWCYTNALEYATGAEKFKNYCDMAMSQEGEKDIGNLAEAKMRISDNYIQHAKTLEKDAEALRNKAFETSLAAPSAPQPAEQPVPAATKKEEKAEKKEEKPVAKDEKVEKKEKKDEKVEKTGKAEVATEVKGEQTQLQLNAKADELNKQAVECNKKALDNLLDMINKWCAAGGILENTKNERALKAIESAYSLLGWAYDGSKDKENACKAFDTFIKKYPQSKTVPVAMFRMGIIYGELKKLDIAAQVLEALADKYPTTQEGKLALSTLSRNMYDLKNFDKSISVFAKILAQNIEASVQDLRWACANLWNCDGKHPKEGAEVAMKAGEMLIVMSNKPVIEDWIGKNKAKELASNPKEQQKILGVIKDKVLFDYSSACYWAGQQDKSLKTADELLSRENTPYFYEGRFLRAMIYRAMKKYDKALENYGEVSMTALSAKKHPIYSKAQCLIGDTYIDMGDYMKAYGSLNITATATPDDLKKTTTKLTPEELQEQLEWLELAIYKSAYALAKMGRSEEKVKMVAKYKQYYPNGKYTKEIDNLPAPEDASAKKPAVEAPKPAAAEPPKANPPPAQPPAKTNPPVQPAKK